MTDLNVVKNDTNTSPKHVRREGTEGTTHYFSRFRRWVPGIDHPVPVQDYPDGLFVLHANNLCSRMTDAEPINGRMVDVLYDADWDARQRGDEPLVWWCENCSVHKDWDSR